MSETVTLRVDVDPEHFWRDVWHRDCPDRSPMIHLGERFTLPDGSVLRGYRCVTCKVECFAGLDASNYVVSRQFPSGGEWPPSNCIPIPPPCSRRSRTACDVEGCSAGDCPSCQKIAALEAENARLRERWSTFREAVLATDELFQQVAKLLTDLGFPDTGASVRQTALVMYTSVQDPAAIPSEGERP